MSSPSMADLLWYPRPAAEAERPERGVGQEPGPLRGEYVVQGLAVQPGGLAGRPIVPVPRPTDRQPVEPVPAGRAGLDVGLDLGPADRPESFLDEAPELFRLGARHGGHGLFP